MEMQHLGSYPKPFKSDTSSLQDTQQLQNFEHFINVDYVEERIRNHPQILAAEVASSTFALFFPSGS